MKYKKTYGAVGLMECQYTIPVGKAHMTVTFKGGGSSDHGFIPAKLTTEDPITQHIIEHSQYFKSGRIVLVNEIAIEEPGDNLPDKEDENPAADEAEDKEPEGLTIVSVDSLADAKAYLVEQFGEDAASLKRRDAVDKSAASHGVKFEYNK